VGSVNSLPTIILIKKDWRKKMPKLIYNPKGEQINADDEQVEILLQHGYTLNPPEKKKAKSVEVEESEDAFSDEESTKKSTKKIKKKK